MPTINSLTITQIIVLHLTLAEPELEFSVLSFAVEQNSVAQRRAKLGNSDLGIRSARRIAHGPQPIKTCLPLFDDCTILFLTMWVLLARVAQCSLLCSSFRNNSNTELRASKIHQNSKKNNWIHEPNRTKTNETKRPNRRSDEWTNAPNESTHYKKKIWVAKHINITHCTALQSNQILPRIFISIFKMDY